jgi:hypothetical protein
LQACRTPRQTISRFISQPESENEGFAFFPDHVALTRV